MTTLLLLTGAVITGRAARRKLHLPIVSLTIVSLCVTIYYAEQLGKLYDLESAGWIYPFHLLIAKVSATSYLVVIGSGLATLRDTARRKTHSTIAYSVITLTVLTAITGTWMILAATPL
ncbi:MAG: hypothetical protein OSB14_04800 [Planctomycetota bacterium]|nr:hypothetical protein [Planctomycetota bacterium]